MAIANAAPVLTVASSCIAERNGKKVVFLVKNDTATLVPVVVGREVGNRIEIAQGLSPADPIVLAPPEDLVDGAKVKSKTN